MSRYNIEKLILNAGERWKKVALQSDKAVFAKEPVWKLSYLKNLEQYIINQSNVGGGDFFHKLKRQLDPVNPAVKKLAAEMLWVMYLCPNNITAPKKLENIRFVWKWSNESFPKNKWVSDVVLGGIGSGGSGFFSNLQRELVFFIRMMTVFKNLAEPKRSEFLSDGWKFAQWLENIPECNSRQLRHMILFLLFPDDFDHIFGGTHRRMIVQKFTEKIDTEVKKMSALEIDRKLFNIRRQKEEEYGTKNLDFYVSPLYDIWQDSKPENDSVSEPDSQKSEASTMKHPYPLNQILYGPPGTSKTYNTVNHALAIIEDKSVNELKEEDRKEVKQRFDKLKEDGRIAMVTFHQNFTYEDFIEGIRPVLAGDDRKDIEYKLHKGVFKEIADQAHEDRDQNYVLIIDEINRGNIAKIFGELITLIESSKRIGGDDAATATLPYSQDSFGVPNNLYIIGTMNTADRSIAPLDTALRRRFEFVEMMPDLEHHKISTDIEGVNCQELLAAMNKRIRFLFDREHQIGHTYFMDVDDMESLAATFKNRIIPLLQEYFYDNWEKIDLVLNCNGFIDPQPSIDSNLFKNSDLIDEERKIYELLPDDDDKWKTPKSYQTIYGEKGEGDNDGIEQDT